ncbi:MAG: hypothetical protein AAEJ52_23140 [Myxococcota bacterium]
MLTSGAGFVVAALLLLACAWSSYVAATRLLPRAPMAVRLSAQLVIAWYGLVVGFFALAAFGGFRPWIALPLCFAIAIACAFGRGSAIRQARADLKGLRHGWVSLGRGVRAVAVAFGLLLLARLARGLVAPPLAWDALTYHLVHAARFVQAGGFVRELAPDNWSYYEFFPTAGEALWAWAMLPVGSDALLAPAGVGVIFAIFVGAFACARSLDVPPERATLMAISVAGSPALLAWATSGYVDNVVVALTAAGSLFIIRNGECPSAREAALAMAAFGLAAAVKLTALPLLACALAALSLQALMAAAHTRGAARHAWQLAIAVLPACVLLIHLVRTWLATGNPLYPFAVDLFGVNLFEGNGEWPWRWLVEMGKEYQPPAGSFTAVERAVGVFWPFGRAGTSSGVHLGFGPAGAALLALAPLGGVALLMRRERRVAALFLAGVAWIAIYAFTLSPFSHHLQHFYSSNPGRYLATALIAVAVLASVARVPAQRAIWSGIAITTLVGGLQIGASAVELPAVIAVALALLALMGLVVRLGQNLSLTTPLARAARGAAILVAICALGAGLTWVRDDLRFRVYAASAQRAAFDGHPLWPAFASSWTIWEAVDQLPAQRIAVSTGWAGLLHNGYRYPLFGSRLQHELVYVSPTRSGEIVDYRLATRLRREADIEAWLARLIARDVTLVVTLEPDTMPESAWAKALPGVFSPLATSASGGSHAYRFNPERARAELR